jgi:hypothetical protein
MSFSFPSSVAFTISCDPVNAVHTNYIPRRGEINVSKQQKTGSSYYCNLVGRQ